VRGVERDAAGFGHFIDSGERFEGAYQHGAGFTFRFAGNVEAIVIAIDEINVGVAGRSKDD